MAGEYSKPTHPNAKAGPSRPKITGKGKERTKALIKSNVVKRRQVEEELRELKSRVDNFVPPKVVENFNQFPLSNRTLKGLKSSHFITPTPIQSRTLPLSLRGADLLCSAQTGSGKTLAFLLPLLDRLYAEKWSPTDGLGAIVISPTRELAIQTFQQLHAIGGGHTFSAALIIGGSKKALERERDRLGKMNILIATPGRLLQHFDGTFGLDVSGVKVLVLDEADRLLDLGFLPTLRAILSHLSPASSSVSSPRQTLLFSATQSSSDLRALAKLSLRDPIEISVNSGQEDEKVMGLDGKERTVVRMPEKLEQYYTVVGLERKLDGLWGFVKSHLKMKGVVFVSSCKQVRFIYETFRRLHPGLPLLHLHGKQKQPTRLSIFQKFHSSPSSLLICTDIASRGLDFPAVDWVIQLDCPEDVETYIHRVGRTARYDKEGKGLVFLCPSEEEGMKKRWEERGIEVMGIKIKESKMGNLKQQMQGFAFREPEIKYLGQRAFISYLRSIHIQKDKSIFQLSTLPIEAYASSLGLPGAPQIKFIDAEMKKAKNGIRAGQKKDEAAVVVNSAGEKEVRTELKKVGKGVEVVKMEDGESSEEEWEEGSDSEEEEEEPVENAKVASEENEVPVESEEEEESSEDEDEAPEEPASKQANAVRTKYDRMFERKNQSILTPHYSALISHNMDDDDDDFLTLEKKDHGLEEVGLGPDEPAAPPVDLSKRKLKQGESRKAMLKLKGTGNKVVFDEEGQAHEIYEMEDLDDFEKKGDAARQREEFVEREREVMKGVMQGDREVAKMKKVEKKRKRRERERELAAEEEGEGAVLASGSDEEMPFYGGGESASEDERAPAKKNKRASVPDAEVEDEEAMALRLLRG